MNLKDLLEQINTDFDISHTNLQDKLYEIPKLHAKYLRIFFGEKVKLNKLESNLAELYRNKYYYYKEDCDRLPQSTKEIEFNILADEEYSELNKETKNQAALVEVLDRAVRKAERLSFDVKNIIEYLNYVNGV